MRKITWLFALAAPVLVVSCQKDVNQDQQALTAETSVAPMAAATTTGNGAESGAHYNLNILGSKDVKSLNMTGGDGHRIFVALGSKTGEPTRTKIMLSKAPAGESFEVLDANGTDGEASFQLPADVSTQTYRVYARALGGPNGGHAIMTTCATGLTIDNYEEVCSTVSTPVLQSGSKPKFTNVSTELFTITLGENIYDTDGNVIINAGETVNIFDDRLEDYFWAYDNNGLKLLQLRFYPIN